MKPDGAASPGSVLLRDSVRPGDAAAVRAMVAATGFFVPAEVEVAVELVEERLRRGVDSGYLFLFAEMAGRPVGYTCYGPIACAVGSYDLYWIVVDPAHQGHGLGRHLVTATEQRIRDAGGRHVYVETSGRPLYLPTRAFYERCGYEVVATLPDFYAPGDDKVVYRKVLRPG